MRRSLGWAVAALAAYVLLGRASLLLATVHLSSSPVWPPAGFAIGFLVVAGLRFWPVILVGAFVVNATSSGDLATSAAIAAGNALEAWTAAWLILRAGGRRILRRMTGVLMLLAAAALGAAISASVGVGSLVAGGASQATAIWQTWFLGNVTGTLLVAPLWLAGRPDRSAAAAAGVGLAAGMGAFASPGWSLIVLLPTIAWLSLRHQRGAIAWGVAGIATGAVAMTLLGWGPFWGRDANEALLLLQLFLVGTATTALTLSAGSKLRDRRPTAASWTGAAMAIGPLVAAAAFIGLALHPTISSLDQERQDAAAEDIQHAWEDAIFEHGSKLTALRGLYEASSSVERREFDHFVEVQGWTFGEGGSTAIGFARTVPLGEVPAYEDHIRNDTSLPDVVRTGFSVFPPPTADVVTVEHVYPMVPDPGAIGVNLAGDPARLATLQQADATDAPTATPPLDIISPTGNLPGFFVSLPVVVDGARIGYIVLAQTVADVAAGTQTNVAHRITDITDTPTVLYHMGDPGPEATSTQIQAWGRTWQLDIATPTQTTSAEAQAPWFILAGGAVLSMAMGSIVYAYDTTRVRAQEMSRNLVEQARVDGKRLAEIKRLEELDAFRRSFLNMVAHELRTPLTPIRTQAYILRQRASEHGPALDILDRGITRLSAVVDDLLVAAKLESEGMTIHTQTSDLGSIAGDAVAALAETAATEGTRLDTDLERVSLPLDATRMAQVADNLLTNALKFAKGGHVQVAVRRHGDEAILEVRDDGLGIDPAKLHDVGTPFVQVHDAQSVGVKGTGLGLYICKAIVKLHGGRLDVQSEGLGKGTTVRVRLPMDEQKKEGKREAEEA